MDPQGYSDNPMLRASDADRDRAASVLNSAMAEGRLTAEEHSDRLDGIYAAKTNADIAPYLADLPAHMPRSAVASRSASGAPVVPGRKDRIVAILSGVTRKGFWRADPQINVFALMGGAELDFRGADLPDGEVTLKATCLLGGMKITVPPEMRVVDSGVSIMGGHDIDGDTPESASVGAPVLRITGTCIMGGIEIRRRVRKPGQSGS
jgi:hypothetical protein